jgi:hypothetical protein
MAHNEKPHLFGNPYVLWNSRPAKNGQPPPCNAPQCISSFAGRKVGAAMRRLPQLQYTMKAKEQILQKWDPVSRTLVNIHQRPPPPPPLTITSFIGTDNDDGTYDFAIVWDGIVENSETGSYRLYGNNYNLYTSAVQIGYINNLSIYQHTYTFTGVSLQYPYYFGELQFGGKTVRSNIIRTSLQLLEITDFVETNNNNGTYDFEIDWDTSLSGITGAYLLFGSMVNAYTSPTLVQSDSNLAISDGVDYSSNITLQYPYYFGELQFGGETFLSSIIRSSLQILQITSFTATNGGMDYNFVINWSSTLSGINGSFLLFGNTVNAYTGNPHHILHYDGGNDDNISIGNYTASSNFVPLIYPYYFGELHFSGEVFRSSIIHVT